MLSDESLEGVSNSPGELGHRCQSSRCSGEIGAAFSLPGAAQLGQRLYPTPPPKGGEAFPAALGGDDTGRGSPGVRRIEAE